MDENLVFFEQEIYEHFTVQAVDTANLNVDEFINAFPKEIQPKIDSYITEKLYVKDKSNLSIEIEDVFDSEIDTDKKDMEFVISFKAKASYLCEPETYDYPGSIAYDNCIYDEDFPTMRKDISEIIKKAFQDKGIPCKDCICIEDDSESYTIDDAVEHFWYLVEVGRENYEADKCEDR